MMQFKLKQIGRVTSCFLGQHGMRVVEYTKRIPSNSMYLSYCMDIVKQHPSARYHHDNTYLRPGLIVMSWTACEQCGRDAQGIIVDRHVEDVKFKPELFRGLKGD